MATVFTNNWTLLLETLRTKLRDEFEGALPVSLFKVANNYQNRYLVIVPESSTILSYNKSSETRQYNINFRLFVENKNDDHEIIFNALNIVNRIESLVVDNVTLDIDYLSYDALNCRVENTELNIDDESDFYVVNLEFVCEITSNFS